MTCYELVKPLPGKLIHGFKAFHADMSCRPTPQKVSRYRVGVTYTTDAPVVLCRRGFHFCRNILRVYIYYARNFDTRICEVEASGPCLQSFDETKCVTGSLRIIRELSPEEILEELHNAHPYYLRCNTESELLASISIYKMNSSTYRLWPTRGTGHYPTKKELVYLDNRVAEWEAAFEKYKQQGDKT